MAGLLSKERIIATPGFNRWLVPPAAPCHPSLHRYGLRLQRVLAAAEPCHRHYRACRLLVKPVNERYYMTQDELDRAQATLRTAGQRA